MKVRKGIIRGFSGTESSVLAFLFIDDEELGVVPVLCDNRATLKALKRCFNNVIGPGNEVDDKEGGHIGQEVYYSYDDEGYSLKGFTPVGSASKSTYIAKLMERRYKNGLDSKL
jgi:hypothetical protein